LSVSTGSRTRNLHAPRNRLAIRAGISLPRRSPIQRSKRNVTTTKLVSPMGIIKTPPRTIRSKKSIPICFAPAVCPRTNAICILFDLSIHLRYRLRFPLGSIVTVLPSEENFLCKPILCIASNPIHLGKSRPRLHSPSYGKPNVIVISYQV
jgi:hypothetical protein